MLDFLMLWAGLAAIFVVWNVAFALVEWWATQDFSSFLEGIKASLWTALVAVPALCGLGWFLFSLR